MMESEKELEEVETSSGDPDDTENFGDPDESYLADGRFEDSIRGCIS